MRKAYLSPELKMETVLADDVMLLSGTGFRSLGDGDWGYGDDFTG